MGIKIIRIPQKEIYVEYVGEVRKNYLESGRVTQRNEKLNNCSPRTNSSFKIKNKNSIIIGKNKKKQLREQAQIKTFLKSKDKP